MCALCAKFIPILQNRGALGTATNAISKTTKHLICDKRHKAKNIICDKRHMRQTSYGDKHHMAINVGCDVCRNMTFVALCCLSVMTFFRIMVFVADSVYQYGLCLLGLLKKRQSPITFNDKKKVLRNKMSTIGSCAKMLLFCSLLRNL